MKQATIQTLHTEIRTALILLQYEIEKLDQEIEYLEANPQEGYNRHADASLWARPGKGKNKDNPEKTAYYFVYSKDSDWRKDGRPRRRRIGKGEDARYWGEQMIKSHAKLKTLTAQRDKLRYRFRRTAGTIAEAFNLLQIDWPPGIPLAWRISHKPEED